MKSHFFWVLLLLLSACSGVDEGSDASSTKDTTAIWLAELERIDSNLLSDQTLNPEKGMDAYKAFKAFARKNPEHNLAPTYLMKAAAIARNIPGKALFAIQEYTIVFTKYPNDTLAPEAEFLVGFTFDQALNDGERAKKAYQRFVDDWPEHRLAAQARDLIKLIDDNQTDLEQIETWKKQTK